MTVDDLAIMIAKTLPTKDEMEGVKDEMRTGFREVNR